MAKESGQDTLGRFAKVYTFRSDYTEQNMSFVDLLVLLNFSKFDMTATFFCFGEVAKMKICNPLYTMHT